MLRTVVEVVDDVDEDDVDDPPDPEPEPPAVVDDVLELVAAVEV